MMMMMTMISMMMMMMIIIIARWRNVKYNRTQVPYQPLLLLLLNERWILSNPQNATGLLFIVLIISERT